MSVVGSFGWREAYLLAEASPCPSSIAQVTAPHPHPAPVQTDSNHSGIAMFLSIACISLSGFNVNSEQ